MKALAKRLVALEIGQVVLSPKVKQWLGYPLTPAEQAQIDAADDASVDPDLDTIHTTNWSTEARTWLGID